MYIGNDLSRGRSETYYYTSTSGGETAITTDTSGKTINYTVGWVSVFLNGVRLHDSDFTATTGNSITGLAALSQDDVVIIEAQHTFSSSDAVPATGGTFTGNVIMSGNLTVNGTTTTIDTQHLIVEDQNIQMGSVDTPTDSTADGGGITLKGTTDKTLQWSNTTKAWEITPKLQQKGSFMQYSTNQALVLGG